MGPCAEAAIQLKGSQFSCAKINLGLRVCFRYANGYHHIESLLLPVDLCDEISLSFQKLKTASNHTGKNDNSCLGELHWKDSLPPYYSASMAEVFKDKKKNILFQAEVWFWDWLEDYFKKTTEDSFSKELRLFREKNSIDLHIVKKIPSPAGLGGGSSNAAYLLNQLFDKVWQELKLNSLERKKAYEKMSIDAVSLGADIPFFLTDEEKNSALVSGIGEVSSRMSISGLSGILGIPHFAFPTKEVYKAIKKPLQMERKLDNYPVTYQTSFRRLIQSLEGADLISHRLSCNRRGREFWSACENEGVTNDSICEFRDNFVYVTNDLFDGASLVYPEESAYLKKIMFKLSRFLSKETIPSVNVFCSMSGSGASFFTMGKLNRDSLHEMVQKFKNKYTNISWYVFSTL